MLLKFTVEKGKVIVSPMRECESGICELYKNFDISEKEAAEFADGCSEEALKIILSAVQKKLGKKAVDK